MLLGMNQPTVHKDFKLARRPRCPLPANLYLGGGCESGGDFASQVPLKGTELGGVPSGTTINDMHFDDGHYLNCAPGLDKQKCVRSDELAID